MSHGFPGGGQHSPVPPPPPPSWVTNPSDAPPHPGQPGWQPAPPPPPPTPPPLRGVLDTIAPVHQSQRRWVWWQRCLWWTLLLPVAVFVWACTLTRGWPRRAAIALAAVIAVVGLSTGGTGKDTSNTTPRAAAGKITAVAGETTLATPPVDRSAAPTKADGYLAALSLDGGPQSPAATEVVTILTGLSGEPAANRPQYDRDAFFERADLNGDCVNTRNEVLRAQALRFEMASSGCVVAKGVWWDAYSGEWFDQPKELQMDHVVALGDAWESGAWGWTDDERRAFSNSAANLNVIAGGENQRKADLGPAEYSPTNPAQRCSYLVQYAAVKAAWELAISPADLRAVVDGFTACPSGARPAPPDVPIVPAPTTAPPTTAPPTAPPTTAQPPPTPAPTAAAPVVKPQPLIPQSSGCHPAYDPCLPITGDLNCGDLSTSQKPVRVKDPTNDPYELDREHDGTGCED